MQGSVSSLPLDSIKFAHSSDTKSSEDVIDMIDDSKVSGHSPVSLPSQEPKRSRDILEIKNPGKRANLALA